MDADVLIKRFARCADPRSSYTSLFFSDEPLEIARAKAICSRCIARTQCLAAAIDREEPCGVWGGEIFVDGVPVAEKRRRGARRASLARPSSSTRSRTSPDASTSFVSLAALAHSIRSSSLSGFAAPNFWRRPAKPARATASGATAP